MKTLFLHVILFIFLGGLFPAHAKNVEAKTLSLAEVSPAAVLESVEKLKAQADKVPSQSARRDFIGDADALSDKLRSITSFEALSEKQRIELVNQYESLRSRAIAANDRGKRRVCKRVRTTGSNLTTTVCQTQAEIDKGAESEEDANFLNLRRPFSEADTTDPRGL